MAKFNSLCQELVNRVIELSVEDIIPSTGVCSGKSERTLRKKILSNLSLVSKRFTLPAQRLIWSFISINLSKHSAFMEMIRNGSGRGITVEGLMFGVDGNSKFKTQANALPEILNGVHEVKTLSIINTVYDSTGERNKWPVIFSIPSLQTITKLELWNTHLNKLEVALPLNVRSLTLWNSIAARSFLSLPRSSSTNLSSIIFQSTSPHMYDPDVKESLITYFQSHGSNIKELHFDPAILPMIQHLLPFTPFLTSLSVRTRSNYIGDIISYVKALPIEARLKSLNIGEFCLEACAERNFLKKLLNLDQLEVLEELYLEPDEATYEDITDSEYDDEDELKEMVSRVLEPAIELCAARRITLYLQ